MWKPQGPEERQLWSFECVSKEGAKMTLSFYLKETTHTFIDLTTLVDDIGKK